MNKFLHPFALPSLPALILVSLRAHLVADLRVLPVIAVYTNDKDLSDMENMQAEGRWLSAMPVIETNEQVTSRTTPCQVPFVKKRKTTPLFDTSLFSISS